MKNIDKNKKKIIELFNQNVRGKQPNTEAQNQQHDGRYGHWLEIKMGISMNNRVEADLYGYEMKNYTTSGKTTFGDWSADEYIFHNKNYNITRDTFLEIFGQFHEKKQRYSWSGKPVPNIKGFNTFGQKLTVDSENNILAQYSYSQDLRESKKIIVPLNMQVESLTLAKWNSASLKKKVKKKFNNKGWFKCVRNSQGVYTSIEFGKTINFEEWIQNVKEGVIFFDSGMYQGNNRPYSQWRANNSFWDSLIIEKY